MSGSVTGCSCRFTDWQSAVRVKDTTDFLKCIEDVNIRKGPFDEMKTVLTTRAVENYYPSCDTHKCLQAIEKVLCESEEIIISDNNCILEAIELTMTSNNCSYLGKHFTKIDDATIGGNNAGSITDIYGAEYINKIIYEECPFDIEEYKRYGDDTFDVSTNTSIEEQHFDK